MLRPSGQLCRLLLTVVADADAVVNQPRIPDDENHLPNRPLTAVFSPQLRLASCDVLDALREADIDGSSISCLQRKTSGEIVLTFRRADLKEKFLRSSVLRVSGTPYAIQDIDRPLTFQIFDAPHELPDLALIPRLAPYCEVLHHRRGFFTDPGWENVHNGV